MYNSLFYSTGDDSVYPFMGLMLRCLQRSEEVKEKARDGYPDNSIACCGRGGLFGVVMCCHKHAQVGREIHSTCALYKSRVKMCKKCI